MKKEEKENLKQTVIDVLNLRPMGLEALATATGSTRSVVDHLTASMTNLYEDDKGILHVI